MSTSVLPYRTLVILTLKLRVLTLRKFSNGDDFLLKYWAPHTHYFQQTQKTLKLANNTSFLSSFPTFLLSLLFPPLKMAEYYGHGMGAGNPNEGKTTSSMPIEFL